MQDEFRGRALDEQGEQGDPEDDPLEMGPLRDVGREREGEGDRDGATLAGPEEDVQPRRQDRRAATPRPDDAPGSAEHDVDHDRPPDEDPDDAEGDRPCIVDELADGDGQADEEEHEGGQEERGELPDRVEGDEARLRQSDPPAVGAEDEAGHDRRDDARLVELVGDEVGAVGEGERDRQLDEVVAGDEHEPGGDDAEREADDGADDDRRRERGDRLERGDRRRERREGDAEHDDRGAVVEEALGLDERRQAALAPGGP